MRHEIILSGSGGQGLILAGTILAEAVGVFEGKQVVQTQSYGIQARGGASQSTVIISDNTIQFPEVLKPNILLCLSQESFEKYAPKLRDDGLLIIDQDLVETGTIRSETIRLAWPFTAEAEKLGRRIVANLIALGTLAAVTDVVKPASIARTIPLRLPRRHLATALAALEVGVKLAEEMKV